MAQLAGLKKEKMIFSKIENELSNYLTEGFPDYLQEFIILHYKNGLTIERTAEKMGVAARTCYRYRLQVLCKLKVLFKFN